MQALQKFQRNVSVIGANSWSVHCIGLALISSNDSVFIYLAGSLEMDKPSQPINHHRSESKCFMLSFVLIPRYNGITLIPFGIFSLQSESMCNKTLAAVQRRRCALTKCSPQLLMKLCRRLQEEAHIGKTVRHPHPPSLRLPQVELLHWPTIQVQRLTLAGSALCWPLLAIPILGLAGQVGAGSNAAISLAASRAIGATLGVSGLVLLASRLGD